MHSGKSYVCITRPRRFGKTVIANMISAFFEKGRDSRELFQDLKIGKEAVSHQYINHYNVIYMVLNEMPDECSTFSQYLKRIKTILLQDLKKAFPECEVYANAPVWDVLNSIYEMEDVSFIFVMDEWDFIFHREFVTEGDKQEYIQFLNSLLKDQPYVRLVYMTGILPIAKYSSGSELNMFLEYTMTSEVRYNEYFGFTEDEVDDLYRRYLEIEKVPRVSREGLRQWYDGYDTKAGIRLYNPRSVVVALGNNNLGSY